MSFFCNPNVDYDFGKSIRNKLTRTSYLYKQLFWGLLSLLLPGRVLGQPPLITRLHQQIKLATHDSSRVNLYNKLAYTYLDVNLDSALAYIQRSQEIVKRIPNKRPLIKTYIALGGYFDRLPDYAKSFANYNQAISLIKKYTTDSTQLIYVQSHLAILHNREGAYSKAIQTALRVERYYETHPQSNFIQQKKTLEAMSPAEADLREDYKQSLGLTYTALASAYSQLNNNDRALLYMKKQKDLFEFYQDQAGEMAALGNLGAVYIKLKNFKEAENYLRQALNLAETVKNNYYTASCLDKLGEALQGLSQFEKAIGYHKKALLIWETVKSQTFQANCSLQLGKSYLALNQYKNALYYTGLAVGIFRQTNTEGYLYKSLEILSQTYQHMGRFEEALAMLQEANQLKGRLTDLEKIKAVTQIQTAFDVERKQQQILFLNKDLAIHKLQIDQRKKELLLVQNAEQASELRNTVLAKEKLLNQSQLKLQAVAANRQQLLIHKQQQAIEAADHQLILYLISLTLLILFISFVCYNYYRQRAAQQLLRQQKNEISLQARQLEELNATKDKLFSVIGHDLRSPVARLKQNFLKVRSLGGPNTNMTQSLSQIDEQIDHILDLLTNLLEWSHSQLKGFQTLKQPVDLSDVVSESISQVATYFSQKDIKLINSLPSSSLVIADKRQLNSVIRNILGNSLKFTPEGGYIRLLTVDYKKQIELQIRDTGIGMSEEQLNQLFINTPVRPGTQGESGTGLGLRLCQEFLNKQEGYLRIESKPNEGTTVKVGLPKAFL